MATQVVMEALSPTMEEGRLVEWKKQEGETVAVGDVLAEVETDKAVMELVARVSGVLLRQTVTAGQTVPVSSPIAVIGQPGEALPMAAGNGAGTAAAVPKPAAKPPPQAASPPAVPVSAPPGPPPSGRLKASPLARKIAQERGLDLRAIRGSGPEGRIVLRDLETARPTRPAAASAAAATPPLLAAHPLPAAPGEGFTDTPLSQMRKTIARRLAQSIGPVPTFYLTSEVDMERVAEAREAMLAAGSEVKVSFNDIIIKVVATALRQHPACNAWWQDDHIRYWHEVHIGMAVAIEDGLITPVIRHADRKTLREIGAEARDLAGRARERRLTPEEYTGSTFSISNLGMLGIDEFTAVINPPESGILAVGRIVQKPVEHAGAIALRRRMRLTMSCDHRVIDGATGARFLQTLKAMLENPLALVW
ncbi:MAG TPA: dihydrolipoamide acetyltransferase family protein [Gemmatimonadales bacterium]|nr:dihydrolipoamide acetyltransferase family protein [Gemmatimonadales bacterium]